ncbi:hypothetical protein BS50DRAFT_93173 [Corynespora cassiicola Philippines]|uniref:Uncharacterized protein n=1 Tax=Corynespora cassiicola Philippines TaxID=1448308 RepID=A0A2T2NEZ2_CORCC|nr:hypothetical protein BS50DRAFT_93173 [Corynespora cassiicola Philippines]
MVCRLGRWSGVVYPLDLDRSPTRPCGRERERERGRFVYGASGDGECTVAVLRCAALRGEQAMRLVCVRYEGSVAIVLCRRDACPSVIGRLIRVVFYVLLFFFAFSARLAAFAF